MDEREDGPQVGSLAEEAGLLLDALLGWANAGAAGAGAGVGDLSGRAAAAFHEVNEHLATDAAECKYCPICRGVHAVRSLSPEVKSHLLNAGASLAHAAAAILATVPPPGSDPNKGDGSTPRSPVERIKIDEGWETEPAAESSSTVAADGSVGGEQDR